MSDDKNELQMDFSLNETVTEGHDMIMGCGPLLPIESERVLMERVQQELKIKLKQVIFFKFCKSQIVVLFNMKKLSSKSQGLKMSERKYKEKEGLGNYRATPLLCSKIGGSNMLNGPTQL
ncbi:Homeobox protein HD1 [Camellia lanceoleosa]|uniref:Homeobox protein HD1 n=1 Tax=Camellia lanceoleosa TaxID=1840588 RepID=A0ACC0HJI5_9ERIC|nr:Homeobox protein HD1 [Camellia lanceoleosa]